MADGKLFVISGPSGAGKGTLVARVLEEHPEYALSISATTRAPRKGEVDGVAYYFMSIPEFEATIERDGFIEYANVHGNYYGTPIAPIEEALATDKTALL